MSKKANNMLRSNTHSYDYYSSKNFTYKNGMAMNNYKNYNLYHP